MNRRFWQKTFTFHSRVYYWRRREREWSCQTRNKRTSTEY